MQTASNTFPMKQYEYSPNTKLWVLTTTMTDTCGLLVSNSIYAFASPVSMLACYNDRLKFQQECDEGNAVRYSMNLVRICGYEGVGELWCSASVSDINELSFYAAEQEKNELARK